MRLRRHASVLHLLLCLGSAIGTPVGAQNAAPPQEPESRSFLRSPHLLPLGLGGAALVTGFLVPIDVQTVPVQGLDPASIRFALDRGIVGNRSRDAADLSDWTRNGAFLMPYALAAITGPGDRSWYDMGRRTLIYGEAFLVSMGLTALGKSAFSRPRPFTYLSEDERPEDDYYDPTRDRAFVSMPSGHASSAWTASGLAMTEFLLYEPDAAVWSRVAVGFLGGALAGSTAALRVAAGQHFPTDVIAGSALGLGSGIAVPLLHRGDVRAPSAEAWLQMGVGTLMGALLGGFVASSF